MVSGDFHNFSCLKWTWLSGCGTLFGTLWKLERSLSGQASFQNVPLRLLDPAVPPLHKVIGPDTVLPPDLSRRKITGSKETVDPRAGNLEDVRQVVNRQERAVLVKQPGQYRVIGLLCTDMDGDNRTQAIGHEILLNEFMDNPYQLPPRQFVG